MADSIVLVLDASAAVSIVRAEATSPLVTRELRNVADAGGRLVVPSHFWLEFLSSLTKRHRLLGGEVLQAVYELDTWNIETIEADRAMLMSTLDLVERFGLTPYDAMYLAIAISVDGKLLTFDRELLAAAGGRAIVHGGHRLSDRPSMYEHDVTWPSYKEASAYLAKLRADALAGRG